MQHPDQISQTTKGSGQLQSKNGMKGLRVIATEGQCFLQSCLWKERRCSEVVEMIAREQSIHALVERVAVSE